MKKLLFYLFAAFALLAAAITASANEGEFIHYKLAVQYKNEKKFDLAIEEFRKVLAAYPDHYHSYMHLAQIRQAQGNHKLVIYNLRKALVYNPGWSRAQIMLAEACAADGQLERAIQEYQTYMSACDPGERDSLQTVINKLMDRMRGGGAADDKKVTAAQAAQPAAAPKQSAAPAVTPIKLDPRAEEAMKKVVELYDAKKYDEMLTAVNEVRAIQSNHPGAYYYAALVRRAKGQNDMAVINFRKALPHPVHGADAQRQLNELTGGKGGTKTSASTKSAQPAQAQAEAAQASADEKTAQAVDSAKYAPIEVRIDSMLSMMTVDTLSDAGQKLLAGIRAFTEGRYDDALREFKKVLSENPNGQIAAQCLYNQGICYYRLRLYKDAENQFNLFLNRFPNHESASRAMFFKACTYQERGDYAVSERLFRQFIQSNRNHAWISRAYERLGDSYADLEQHKKAIDAYTQALAGSVSHTDKVIINFKLGSACVAVGDKGRAITYFQAAVDAGEKNNIFMRVPDSYYKIADLRFQQKELAPALEVYKRVTRKYPAFQETPWGLFQIAGIQRNQKQYREAVDTYKELMEKYPDDYWAKQAKWKLEDTVWEHEFRNTKK